MTSPAAEFTAMRKQLLVNSALLGLSKFISTGISLMTVPFVLSRLGLSGYGSWEAMMAMAALITVFQTTVSGTLVWKMSMAYGRRDNYEIQHLIGTGLSIVLTMFFIITPLVWSIRIWLIDLSNIPHAYRGAAGWVVPILVSQTTLGAIGDIFGSVLISNQRAGIATLIQTASLIANNIFVIVGLINGWHIYSLLLGNTVGMISAVFGQYLAARMICGAIHVRPRLPAWSEALPLIKYASFLALGQISIALRDQTDKLVLASVGNTVWTAWFGLASRLANLTLVVCSFFYVPLISTIAALVARDDWRGVRRIYTNMTIGMPYLCGAFVVVVASGYDRLLTIWIGHSVPQVGSILFILLSGNITAIVLTGVGSSLCKGINKVSIETTYIIICAIANVALKLILIPWLGPIGAVLSSATSWALGSVLFIILLHRAIDLPNTAIRAAAMLPMMLLAVLSTRILTKALPLSTTRWDACLDFAMLGFLSVTLFSVLLIATRVLPTETVRHTYIALRANLLSRVGVRYGF
jgi:O-antigen/teichoic acid export membrane protein